VKVPVSWLYEHLDATPEVEALAHLLTMGGVEVEGISSYEGASGSSTPVFETYVTPNRGDCLSIQGMARESAAMLGVARKPLDIPEGEPGSGPAPFAVTLEAPELCPRYVGLLVRNVEVGPSPAWLVEKLEAGGIRSVNNIVDITNYILLELGQPLHAFDFDELIGAEIIVRRAEPAERFELIDHTERTLDPEMLVIADVQGAVALAGVMGGVRSEISDATENVLIESAHFNPQSVRRTARIQGIASEASFRFERGVDPSGCARAAVRAALLMRDLAGGEIVWPLVDAKVRDFEPVPIVLRPSRANLVLGTEIPAERMVEYLRRLELTAEQTGDDAITVGLPAFRPDLLREADLIEEVARVHGYDEIPERLPVAAAIVGGLRPDRKRADRVRGALIGCGFLEMVTQGMCDPTDLDRLGYAEDAPERCLLTLENALASDLLAMRREVASSLLRVVARNQSHRAMDVYGFEVGRVYERGADGAIVEPRHLGIVLTGTNMTSLWNVDPKQAAGDFFRLKAAVERALATLTDAGVEFRVAERAPFDPACCAEVLVGGEVLGACGRIAAEVADSFEVTGAVYLADVVIEGLLQAERPRRIYEPLPRFPGVNRDLAIVVERDTPAEQVEACIRGAGGEALRSLALFDLYEGKNLGEGKRSLAYALEFRIEERTLTNDEVDERIAAIVAALESELGAKLRS
jgi:phenylalanyl-tRNA synthetase beta chain